MIFILCERKEDANNLKEIVKVPGIDVVVVGSLHLSLSLGIPGQLNNPLEQEAMARELISENVYFITIGVHELVKSGIREYMIKARARQEWGNGK